VAHPLGSKTGRDVAQGTQASCHSRLGAREAVTAAETGPQAKR